jgi:predicted nucleic acid-binding protein
MYLLDSDVIVELRKAGSEKANENVVKWANSVPTAGTFLSAITILELEIAILEFEWQDEERGAIMRKWLDDQSMKRLPVNARSFTAVARIPKAQLCSPQPPLCMA